MTPSICSGLPIAKRAEIGYGASRMRVALLYVDALKEGGYPRDARWLAGALAERCRKVWLVADDGIEYDGLKDSVSVVPPSKARSLRPDVAHGLGLLLPRQLLLQRMLRAQVHVLSPWGHLMAEHLTRGRNKTTYLRLVRPLLPPRLTIHLLSEQEQEGAIKYLGHRPTGIASLGVFPAPQDEGQQSGDYLLFFGRNDIRQKGIDFLIDGLKEARHRGLVLPLVIAGAEHANSTAELRLRVPNEGVDILGPVTEAEKWQLVRGARALVFLSRWDGPPRPIREALSVGTPVIVSYGTNMGELVNDFDAGAVVDYRPTSVAEALLAAQDLSNVESWRKGAAKLSKALSWGEVASNYARIYRLALSQLR